MKRCSWCKNEKKIKASINNVQRFIEIPAKTKLSEIISKDLKK
ncbi:DNA-3-methyladenine glycosylase I [Crassaminicella profunda]|nr:DNA-3-methyladenine glycosylase I [Crassaminicella profunda]